MLKYLNEESFPITPQQLNDSWRRWINDSSLRSVLRFGQYVVNKYCPADCCWPEAFYADTDEAYKLLYTAAQHNMAKVARQSMDPVDWLDV